MLRVGVSASVALPRAEHGRTPLTAPSSWRASCVRQNLLAAPPRSTRRGCEPHLRRAAAVHTRASANPGGWLNEGKPEAEEAAAAAGAVEPSKEVVEGEDVEEEVPTEQTLAKRRFYMRFYSWPALGKWTAAALALVLTGAVAVLEVMVQGGIDIVNQDGTVAILLMRGKPQFPALLIAYLASALAAAALGYAVLPLLRALKAAQVVRTDGPMSHAKKKGTPTMGGLSFLPVAVTVACLLTDFAPAVVATSAATVAYALLGCADDVAKMLRKNSRGVSLRAKLAVQAVVALSFCYWVCTQLAAGGLAAGWATATLVGSLYLPLGAFYWPLGVFVMTAQSNAVNLTDGLDGLSAGTTAAAFVGLAVVVLARATTATAAMELAVFCCAMAGAAIGFLAHNRYRAVMFMGDTGSLALGGVSGDRSGKAGEELTREDALRGLAQALGAVAVAAGPSTMLPLLVTTGLFAAEAASVIIQVAYYKATKGPDGVGRRLFRMAPFHHHLELGGWPEVGVVQAFYLAALLFASGGGLVAVF